jgi:hypothetical protein
MVSLDRHGANAVLEGYGLEGSKESLSIPKSQPVQKSDEVVKEIGWYASSEDLSPSLFRRVF